MTNKQQQLIKDYIQECKSDGESKDKTAAMLPSFMRSLATQTDDYELRELATNSAEVAKLVSNYW